MQTRASLFAHEMRKECLGALDFALPPGKYTREARGRTEAGKKGGKEGETTQSGSRERAFSPVRKQKRSRGA